MAEQPAGSSGAPEQLNEAEIIRRYEEKKRLLEVAGTSHESKETFKEAFREHVSETIGEPTSKQGVNNAALPTFNDDAAPKAELDVLISLALEKGVYQAVQKATHETPYLIDALHDELADHYYDKLIAAGKLSG